MRSAEIDQGSNNYPYIYQNELERVGFNPVRPVRGVLTDDMQQTRLSNGQQYYQTFGFDASRAINDTTGPIVEIAGPTEGGYACLADVELPSRPLITNISSTLGLPQKLYDAEYSGTVLDAIADGRNMPFRSESIGMLLVSCMLKADPYEIGDLGDDHYQALVIREYNRAIREAHNGDGVLPDNYYSPCIRVELWKEAARVLLSDGLFVMRGVDDKDIELGESVGFQLVAHTPFQRVSRLPFTPEEQPHEVIFIKK